MADISKLNLTGSDLDIKDNIARQKLTVVDPTEGEGLITFGVDANGNYGYKKVGADTVTPFLSGGGDNNDNIFGVGVGTLTPDYYSQLNAGYLYTKNYFVYFAIVGAQLTLKIYEQNTLIVNETFYINQGTATQLANINAIMSQYDFDGLTMLFNKLDQMNVNGSYQWYANFTLQANKNYDMKTISGMFMLSQPTSYVNVNANEYLYFSNNNLYHRASSIAFQISSGYMSVSTRSVSVAYK